MIRIFSFVTSSLFCACFLNASSNTSGSNASCVNGIVLFVNLKETSLNIQKDCETRLYYYTINIHIKTVFSAIWYASNIKDTYLTQSVISCLVFNFLDTSTRVSNLMQFTIVLLKYHHIHYITNHHYLSFA